MVVGGWQLLYCSCWIAVVLWELLDGGSEIIVVAW